MYSFVRELLFDVPTGWEVQIAEEGEAENCPFFHNTRTDESQWEHPLQQAHKHRVDEMLRTASTSPARQRNATEKQERGGRVGQGQHQQADVSVHNALELEDFDDDYGNNDDTYADRSLGSPTPPWRNQPANEGFPSRRPSKEAAAGSTSSNVGSRKTVRWEDLSSEPISKDAQQRFQSPATAAPAAGVRQVARFDPVPSNNTPSSSSSPPPATHNEEAVAALKVRASRKCCDGQSSSQELTHSSLPFVRAGAIAGSAD